MGGLSDPLFSHLCIMHSRAQSKVHYCIPPNFMNCPSSLHEFVVNWCAYLYQPYRRGSLLISSARKFAHPMCLKSMQRRHHRCHLLALMYLIPMPYFSSRSTSSSNIDVIPSPNVALFDFHPLISPIEPSPYNQSRIEFSTYCNNPTLDLC